MTKVPSASVVGCMMYVMVCTMLDIGYDVKVLRPGRKHWIYEKPWKRALCCGEMDILVLERYLKYVPTIRLR